MAFLVDDLLIAGAIASLLASVGGTAFSQLQQNAIKDQQKKNTLAEAVRQRQFREEKSRQIDETAPEFSPEEQTKKREAFADDIEEFITPVAEDEASFTSANKAAPKVVQDSLASKLAESLDRGKQNAKNLAQISSFRRLNTDNALNLNRVGENIAQINQNQIGSSNILPFEQQQALNKGSGFGNAAAVLDGVGNVADAFVAFNLLNPSAPRGGRIPGSGNFNTLRSGRGPTLIPTGFQTGV